MFPDDDVETHEPAGPDVDDGPGPSTDVDDADALEDEDVDDDALEDEELGDDIEAPAAEADDDAAVRAAPASSGDDDEGEQASLEALLAERARHGSDDADTGEIVGFDADDDPPPAVDLPARANPVKSDAEFVCSSCYLVKPRVQLADAARALCRDCV